MDYDGPTPEESWLEELRRIAPPHERTSWLKLCWEPGDPWQVDDPDRIGGKLSGSVHRWVVYQMMPPHLIPELVLCDLKGPSPRVRGRYDSVLQKFVPDPRCNVSLMQWNLYRETGCYGRPYWVVQGSGGGHKMRFNRVESAVSQMNGGPKQPALPGELPFARPDRRTFDALHQADRVRRYGWLLDKYEKDPERYYSDDPEMGEKAKAVLRGEVWSWLEGQVQDVVKDNSAVWRNMEMPEGDGSYEGRLAPQLFS